MLNDIVLSIKGLDLVSDSISQDKYAGWILSGWLVG